MAAYIQEFFEERGVAVSQQVCLSRSPQCGGDTAGARSIGDASSLKRIPIRAGIAGMTIPPFEPRLDDGKLYGRGACDTKEGVAAMMHAVASLVEDRIQPRCEVIFAGTADEEYSYRGVVKLCERLRADAAVVSEPTSLAAGGGDEGLLAIPHPGSRQGCTQRQTASGRECDLAYGPADRSPGGRREGSRLAGRTHYSAPRRSISALFIAVVVNIVPESCVIEIDRRLVPGEELEDVWRWDGRLVADLQMIRVGIRRGGRGTDAAGHTARDIRVRGSCGCGVAGARGLEP